MPRRRASASCSRPTAARSCASSARKGFSPEERRDLTQETFLGIYKGLGGFRHESRFESWLYRLATTTYLKRLRSAATDKRRGHEVVHDEAAPPPGTAPPTRDDPLRGMLREERREALRQAVRALPDQMRRCLTLRIYHELSYREIATVMKIEIDTVKAHLFQARERLRSTVDVAPSSRRRARRRRGGEPMPEDRTAAPGPAPEGADDLLGVLAEEAGGAAAATLPTTSSSATATVPRPAAEGRSATTSWVCRECTERFLDLDALSPDPGIAEGPAPRSRPPRPGATCARASRGVGARRARRTGAKTRPDDGPWRALHRWPPCSPSRSSGSASGWPSSAATSTGSRRPRPNLPILYLDEPVRATGGAAPGSRLPEPRAGSS